MFWKYFKMFNLKGIFNYPLGGCFIKPRPLQRPSKFFDKKDHRTTFEIQADWERQRPELWKPQWQLNFINNISKMFYKRGNAFYCFIILAGFLCYLEIMLQWFSLLVCFEAFKRRLDLNGKGKITNKGNCQIWWYFMNCIS